MDQLLSAIANFAIYFFSGLIALIIFKFCYALVTPQDEWKLIKEDRNIAASIGFGGGILGFAIALSGAISNSVSFVDFITWAVVALVAQTIAFAIVRFGFMPKIVERIQNEEISAGIMLGVVSVAVGMLNAASMTY
ncbi:DUF350 domain-containing protein [Hahella ganghwensis]|uniref:DUF350 domain-containing protein n=1 Tax=Hahella ganghwensis TaxID=286420 RepID=UPI0003752499|nr:DUF350 domain-containing protein [Hahella ganghwensis]